jgi:hypothetical protein
MANVTTHHYAAVVPVKETELTLDAKEVCVSRFFSSSLSLPFSASLYSHTHLPLSLCPPPGCDLDVPDGSRTALPHSCRQSGASGLCIGQAACGAG